jgi:formamidopyrimidine-DNA glycosylase
LYHAKLHPEQYCDEFSDAEISSLFKSIRYVCQTAVDKLGDSEQFPEHWLFSYRWGKGSKGHSLPNGETLAFIQVGGRTSCYVPAVQKKTGHIPSKAETIPFKGASGDEASKKPPKAPKATPKPKDETSEIKSELAENKAGLPETPPKQIKRMGNEEASKQSRKTPKGKPTTEKAEKRKETAKRKPELAEDETKAPVTAPSKKKQRKTGEHDTEPSDEAPNVGSRRSARLRGK